METGRSFIADQFKVVIPGVLEFLVHERDEMQEVTAAALVRLMLVGEDFVVKACEHGCIPKLVNICSCDIGFPHELLMCLQLIIMTEPCKQMAAQHGILPLLFLQDGKVMTDRYEQHLVFDMLKAYWKQQRSLINACQHGCIPKTIDACWHATGFHQRRLLLCLERMTFGEPYRKMALQHQILPLLFQSLQDWNSEKVQAGWATQEVLCTKTTSQIYPAETTQKTQSIKILGGCSSTYKWVMYGYVIIVVGIISQLSPT